MDINLLSVLVAALASMALGFLWYGPIFGKPWMALMKFFEADMKKAKEGGMGKTYAMMAVTSLVSAYVLAVLIGLLDAASVDSALRLAAWLWLGLVATVTYSGVLWEGKPVKLWVLNNGYNLLNLLVMAAILVNM